MGDFANSIHYKDGIRFFHPLLPAAPSARLAAGFPLQENDGFTMFTLSDRVG